MKVTRDFFINFLIEFYQNKYAHEDIILIYTNKLKVILKTLGLSENSIVFDEKNHCFKFISNSIYIKDNSKSSSILSYIQYDLNKLFDYITRDFTVANTGDMTTTDNIISYRNYINQHQSDMILRSHNTAMKDVYKDSIYKIMEYIFMGTILIPSENTVILSPFCFEDGIKYNESIIDEEDLSIMNASFDEFDYF